jgi:hypothetical protein
LDIWKKGWEREIGEEIKPNAQTHVQNPLAWVVLGRIACEITFLPLKK